MKNVNDTSSLFPYHPSIPAASIFLALFTLTTVWHIYQIIRWKSWYITALILCGILEITGFSCRLASIQHPSNTGLYSAQYAFLVLAPIFLAASVYVMLGRIIVFVNGRSLIPGKCIAYIFVGCDIVSFFVQIVGAIFLLNANSRSNFNLGKDILLGGLVIQIVTFAFFITIAVHFDITVDKNGKLRWLMRGLYMASGLILSRSIYRVIEFSGDDSSYLQVTEWPFYIFDSVFILISMVIFNINHPAKCLSADNSIPTVQSSSKNEVQINGPSIEMT